MKRWLGAMVLGGVILCMAPLASPASAADASSEAQFVNYINSQRSGSSEPTLGVNTDLTGVARGWADHMLAAGGLSHNPNLGTQAPAGWAVVGENVGMGPSVSTIDNAFWNSSEHRANILGNYDVVGVGVDIRSDGMMFVTVDFLKWQASASGPTAVASSCTSSNPPATPSAQGASGYYVLGSDGGIFSYGSAPFHGSVPGTGATAQAILMAVTPSQQGYWVLGSNGQVFAFGDARNLGSALGVAGADIKPTNTGNGYWILGQDGSVYNFGDAANLGSLPAVGVRDRAVKLVPTPSGHGYWILGADGGIFSFGDAAFHGSLPGLGIHNTSVSMASTPSGRGYWVLGADGGIFSFGDAAFHGSVPGIGCTQAIGVQLIRSASGNGYYILSSDGRVFSFGDAPNFGQPASLHVTTLDLAVIHS